MIKIILLSVVSLALFTGCYLDRGYVVRDAHHYDEHQPPAHAPAHGRRAHYNYHYYPDADFYFDAQRSTYFYINRRGQWVLSLSLPDRLHRYLNTGYVEIDMEDDRPYNKHKEHKDKYKKHKHKVKHKNNEQDEEKSRKYSEKESRKNKNSKYEDER